MTDTQKTDVPYYWDTDVEHVETLLRTLTPHPLHRWKCPCGELDCRNYVVYGKFQYAGQLKLIVLATMTFDRPPGYAAVVGPDDIDKIPHAQLMHPSDRQMYEIYLRCGLADELRKALAPQEVN